MSVRVLMLAARTLKERGGAVVLLRPQRPVARLLGLLGADQMIMVRADAEVTPKWEAPQRTILS
jgi:anti-anti-sigma regulatory factor